MEDSKLEIKHHARAKSLLTGHRESSSTVLIPSGSGELLHFIVNKLSSIYSVNSLNPEAIAHKLVTTVETLVAAESFELFTLTNGRLQPMPPLPSNASFLVHNRSLLGLIAQTKLHQIFNSPSTSALYKSFHEQSGPLNTSVTPRSVCGVPLVYPVTGELFGVLMMYNKLSSTGAAHVFQMNDVHLVQSIALLLLGYTSSKTTAAASTTTSATASEKRAARSETRRVKRADSLDPASNTLDTIIKKGRRYRLLQQWCKQVFVVTNRTESKQVLCKNILQRIFGQPTPEVMIECSILLLGSLINTEYARIAYKTPNSYLLFSVSDALITESATREEAYAYDEVDTAPVYTSTEESTRRTIVYYPIVNGSQRLVIELCNKKDDTLRHSAEFTREDLNIAETLGSPLLEVIDCYLHQADCDINELRNLLKGYLSSLNLNPILATIRTASQQLLDCDRATVYLREGNTLVMTAQGDAQDMPVGFSVPIGKGIVGHVVESATTVNIQDAYADERFNQEVDRLTGYSTKSILCMPVMNNGEVVGALQMINKEGGSFNEHDEETLDLFSEMVGSVLLNWELFQKSLEERTRLINILNSIGNCILVLNDHGQLTYWNKPIYRVLGIEQRTARDNHYTVWLRYNRQLVSDITTVYRSPARKIRRASQTLGNSASQSEDRAEFKTFNYTILALQEISGESSGVIVILEDATQIEELHLKYRAMKTRLMALTEPVHAFNSLQQCISQLESVATTIEPTSNSYAELGKAIHTLKRGNLYKATIHLPQDLKPFESQLHSRMIEFNSDATPLEKIQDAESRPSLVVQPSVGMEEVLDWSMDCFSVTEPSAVISAMLHNLKLMHFFTIQEEVLNEFVCEVKTGYELHNNPYHNFAHGLSVMHSAFVMLHSTHSFDFFNLHEVFAILISALCHDIGHTGFNNMFEVARQSELALVYNDISVLENFHASMTFKILQKPQCNVFESVPARNWKVMRKLMIESILATDMGKHFRVITDLTSRFNITSETPLGTMDEDTTKLAGFFVHAMDLAHPTKSFEIYSVWSNLVCKEFSQQVERERALGLPVTEFMLGLDDPLRYYRNEIGFLTAMVEPLWACFHLWVDVSAYREALAENLEVFRSKLAALENADSPDI